ncbi:UNVERIFIED_CONTAM: hypothetical protein Sindi_3000600 [Sesamum indicum]
MEASRAAGDGLHPRPSAPGGTHTGRVWSSSSSVARDPEISSTWLAKCRQSRHARLPHGSWGMLLGALASSPSPAKVEASHRQVGPVPRFLLLGSQLVLRPESSCLPGHAWACLLPFACRDARMRRGTAGVGLSARALRTHSIVPNVPFSPCAAPLGAAARGGPQGARCVPRPAHGRTCPGRWPIASSPDLSDAEHTVGTRPRPLFAPKASVRRFVRTTPATVLGSSHAGGGVGEECYLVDPASSHMLVSKIKPCMFKKLVVGPWVGPAGPPLVCTRSSRPFCRRCAPGLNWPGRASGAVTLKKLECSKQAYALYTLAWDNIIGFRSYYVGLRDRTFAKDVFINQERKLGARRRSDTVLVSTINDADQGSADVAFRTPPAPYEKSKSLGSGGSMVARLKLKGIDGRAPPGVEPAA